MTDPAPSTLPAQPWYTSAVQKSQVTAAISALLALSPKLGSLLGLNTPVEVQAAVEAVFGVIALIAPVIGSILRAHSTVQPLTLTQKGADTHPTNLAVGANAPPSTPPPIVASAPSAIIPPDPTRPPHPLYQPPKDTL
jgi:hypothetical protein